MHEKRASANTEAPQGKLVNFKAKELNSVVIANILDQFSKKFNVVGILPVFDPLTDEVAEDSPKILMAGVGQEAAGVSEHPDKVA